MKNKPIFRKFRGHQDRQSTGSKDKEENFYKYYLPVETTSRFVNFQPKTTRLLGDGEGGAHFNWKSMSTWSLSSNLCRIPTVKNKGKSGYNYKNAECSGTVFYGFSEFILTSHCGDLMGTYDTEYLKCVTILVLVSAP